MSEELTFLRDAEGRILTDHAGKVIMIQKHKLTAIKSEPGIAEPLAQHVIPDLVVDYNGNLIKRQLKTESRPRPSTAPPTPTETASPQSVHEDAASASTALPEASLLSPAAAAAPEASPQPLAAEANVGGTVVATSAPVPTAGQAPSKASGPAADAASSTTPSPWVVPRGPDGSVDPQKLQLALVDANRKIDAQRRTVLWGRMSRRLQSRDCPPLLREKWEQALTREGKNECFSLYLACGGDVGKMTAVEEVIRIDRHEHKRSTGWYTRDDLIAKFHGEASKVDELIKRKTAGGLTQDHPDFPGDPEMMQYQCLEFEKNVQSKSTEVRKALHWTGLVSGQVAKDMASTIENLFDVEKTIFAPIAAVKGGGGGRGGRGGGRGGGVPKPKKTKIHNPQQWACEWAQKSQSWVALLREAGAKLSGKPFAEALVVHIDNCAKDFEKCHGTFIAKSQNLPTSPAVDCQGQAILTSTRMLDEIKQFRESVKRSAEYMSAADSMLGAKKRKYPVEPQEQTIDTEESKGS